MTNNPATAGARPAILGPMQSVALILVLVLALPAATLAAWRFWSAVPPSPAGGPRALDAIWTLVPLALLVALIAAVA